jgi:diguanylate cyclase (GGDEF)-like protein/putative nucleotidyltransferase with HDIG domain
LTTSTTILAIAASMAVFTLLNHFIVGIVVWMARGENFQESGIFDFMPLIIDLSLLILGGTLVLLWNYNPYSLLLFALPIYMIYGTMRVPALERQSETDQKTGLFNHTYFKEHLENELKRANRFDRPITIIMADLDLLRNINNTYGHLAGDEVLIGVANILKKSVREYDVVARFGGEEYAILMPETTLSQGYERAEAIRQAVQSAEFTIPTSVTPIKATLSLGVAEREEFSQSGQDIIHNADLALYRSKLKGRNKVYAYSKEKYVKEEYVDYAEDESEAPIPTSEPAKDLNEPANAEHEASAYSVAANAKTVPLSELQSSRLQNREEKLQELPTSPTRNVSKGPVYAFISGLFILALAMFGGVYLLAPSMYMDLSIQSWLGLAGIVVLLVITEWYSIDLYTKNTSLSTSAVPILAGALLFGPIALLILSLTYAISTGVKHRSPPNRFFFNFSNQLFAGMLYTTIIAMTGIDYIEMPTVMQLIIAVLAAIIVYLFNTSFISIGVHLEIGHPLRKFWKEHYSWLFPLYIGMGIVAAAFVFGYKHDPLIGSLLVIIPLLLLRISQVQYVERTKEMVVQMRKKNQDLERYSDEITKLNDGLLDTLAEIIDLRDPYVLGHSRGVTEFSTKLARRMGLHERQVELVRKGSLLHDIGKLGISQDILAKPDKLTPEEYETIKRHPGLGSALLEKSPHLHPLIPIVRSHHEHINGEGYPDKLCGNQISIEARIISVADAVEAMSTDRPYRKACSPEYIVEELERCSGTQFDPQVTKVAVEVLQEREAEKEAKETTRPINSQLKRAITNLETI